MILIGILSILILESIIPTEASTVTPEQVTLAYNGNPTEMMITWITMKGYSHKSVKSEVHFGLEATSLSQTVNADDHWWKDELVIGRTRYTHRAVMTGLIPGRKYYYTVGSSEGTSSTFSFTAVDPSKKEFKAAIFGDLGVVGGHALPSLIDAAQRGEYDMFIHIGDFAYDLHEDEGKKGDIFMNSIQNISAFVPYMAIAGNHESHLSFQHYKNRFTMPSNGVEEDNQFWSINFGDVHFVGISSEYYNYDMFIETNKQYEWLEKDLQQNNQPWTVLFQHRPFYCSNDKPDHCNAHENIVTRDGQAGMPGLETLINKKGVDMAFWGHEHTYERMYPVYQNLAFKQRDSQNFHNSPTTVYTISGAAGCHDHMAQSNVIPAPFSAVRLQNYGYSVLHVYNSTVVSTYFVPSDQPESKLDVFTLSKDPGYKPGQKL